MLVGLIADTHGMLRPEVTTAFAGVDRIFHAGDVGSEEVLDGLAAIAPVDAVWGNADGTSLRSRSTEVLRVELEGIAIVVVHGMQVGSPTPARVAAAFPDADLVVFGHSHRPVVEAIGGVLAVNPGSAGRRRFRNPVSVALAELAEGKVTARLVQLVADRDAAPSLP